MGIWKSFSEGIREGYSEQKAKQAQSARSALVPAESTLPGVQREKTELEMSRSLNQACEMAREIRAGHAPQSVDLWGPVLKPHEQGRVKAEMLYSRLYGTNANYVHNNLFVFGSQDFVLGAWGVNALVNAARKAQAQRHAAVQWRDHELVTTVVTSERVICKTAARGWLSFAFSRVVEFEPDLDRWSMLLAFSGEAAPLHLLGPATPEMALWTAHGVLGPRWMDDPRLDRLR